jgi:hypothetical protein
MRVEVYAMKHFFGLAGLAALLLSGCGGSGGGSAKGEVAGIVSDANGNPVRGARVFASGKETYSNSSGAFVLSGVGEGDHLIRAEITQNGVDFNGQNVARIFRGERSKSLNIAVVRRELQARLHGTVRDRFGNRLIGVRIFAMGNALTASMAITDSNGDYSLRGLMAGVTYALTATGRTYDSDLDTVILAANEDREMNFVLGDGSNPAMPAPENLVAVAWTSPFEATRSSARQREGLEAVKAMVDPRRKRTQGRTTINGNHVEVDLFWDPYFANFSSLLGFGIYRATSAGGASTAIDFMRDPNAAFFMDIEEALREHTNYYYEITALNVWYPDTFNSESDFSNRYGVRTLGDLFLNPATQGPLTFRWQAGSGAESYIVYLFENFPGIGQTSVWNNESSPAVGTSLVYSGPALQSGRRYYYVVLGVANGNDSRTISIIDDFVAN